MKGESASVPRDIAAEFAQILHSFELPRETSDIAAVRESATHGAMMSAGHCSHPVRDGCPRCMFLARVPCVSFGSLTRTYTSPAGMTMRPIRRTGVTIM